MAALHEKLEQRLREMTGLPPEQVKRVAREAIDVFSQTVEAFVTARHADLQREGYTSEAIYEVIRTELGQWRFAAPELSVRQIRRLIYG